MRGRYLFVAGIMLGLGVQMAVGQNHGVVGLNHVGISVPDLDEAVRYYTETMGFPEAFRAIDVSGQVALVYVQVSRNTFVELQPSNSQRPPGISHFGLHVEDMTATTASFRERGANVGDMRVGSTKVILSNISDPNGIRIELVEIPPGSMPAQAIERWQ